MTQDNNTPDEAVLNMPEELFIYETKLELGVTYWKHHGNRKTISYTRTDLAQAEIAKLKERLEISHAWDGDGNRIPFPNGCEHHDAVEARDETIKGLEARLARRNERIEALEGGLKEIVCDGALPIDVFDSQECAFKALANGGTS